MIIDTITFSSLRTIGNYSNDKFEATAVLSEGDCPKVCSEQLKQYVLGVLSKDEQNRVETNETKAELQQLTWKRNLLENEIYALETRVQNLKNFLERHGVTINLDHIDVPF